MSEMKRENFFKRCKDDVQRILKMIGDAGELTISKHIVGVVKVKGKCYSVYSYNIAGQEYKVSKKLHEYLLEQGAIEADKEPTDGQKD